MSESKSTSAGARLFDILIAKYLKPDEKDDPQIDPHIIHHELNTFFFGGHDTTSLTSTFTLMMVGSHPEVQAQLYEELEQVFEGMCFLKK